MNEWQGGQSKRVALFVDGDNLSPSLAERILKIAERLGTVVIRRVYAAEAGFRGWGSVLGFRPIQVGGAKNGTDLCICIDVVELACKGAFQSIVIASDDRDFAHLAHWLREHGLHVQGLGTSKSPQGWRAACSDFMVMGASAMATTPEPSPAADLFGPIELSEIDAKIRDVILEEGDCSAIKIGHLGVCMTKHHQLTLEDIGLPNWRTYLIQKQCLYKLDPKGPAASVRWIGPPRPG